MINGQRVIAIIPARGGSKGLPGKNIRKLVGKPLIAWSIAAAAKSQYIDRCIISTDDAEIAQVAQAHGGEVPFMRPSEFAQDDSPTHEAIDHALAQLPGFDILVVLQPTSPLRTASDIDHTLEKLDASGAEQAVSVCEPSKSPYWSYRIDENQRLRNLFDPSFGLKRRQELPSSYVLNGAVFASRIADRHRVQGSEHAAAYVMPYERSLDIDTEIDFKLAACLLNDLHQNIR